MGSKGGISDAAQSPVLMWLNSGGGHPPINFKYFVETTSIVVVRTKLVLVCCCFYVVHETKTHENVSSPFSKVSVNARHGLLGHFASEELYRATQSTGGMNALTDWLVALNWVQDNIESFGF